MKATLLPLLAGLAAQRAAGHATFQQLWVDGADMICLPDPNSGQRHGSQCARVPRSNSPVTNLGGADLRCNVGGGRGVAGKCPVPAGGTVTVEMHAQPGDRSCKNEAIGGAHYGPVMVYLSKVPDAARADGSTPWFKIFENGWSSAGSVGDNDQWGVKDLNKCCGKMDVPIPRNLASGDYLLRAEVIALHTAGSPGQAQLYMTCYQITVTGGGTWTPASSQMVSFPGAYKTNDPGILVNIHSKLNKYVVPGPKVAEFGSTKTAGSGCSSGCAKTCTAGSGKKGTIIETGPGDDAGGGSAPCAQARFEQCGGQGWTGCTSCMEGSTCKDVSGGFYSQCV
ncbi:hypothetical protein MAPG_10154 [Magnaporthiopsis poae ATCC 64411]|uniref:lytic cellulose monooxygenase (C4-dehydrogenating) n=1 Tax=Magnaporthiopsis poae (strain ATCC 64411 / 73-15) TaxID=644358 RepID=A0A0C4EBU5_MAGP6|nr:hypothetical protein MAPG_10154 [Magnaporthiopsis poae ATCC 64411]